MGQRKLEELNPYAYVANNPVNFIDPNQTFNPAARPPRVTTPPPEERAIYEASRREATKH